MTIDTLVLDFFEVYGETSSLPTSSQHLDQLARLCVGKLCSSSEEKANAILRRMKPSQSSRYLISVLGKPDVAKKAMELLKQFGPQDFIVSQLAALLDDSVAYPYVQRIFVHYGQKKGVLAALIGALRKTSSAIYAEEVLAQFIPTQQTQQKIIDELENTESRAYAESLLIKYGPIEIIPEKVVQLLLRGNQRETREAAKRVLLGMQPNQLLVKSLVRALRLDNTVESRRDITDIFRHYGPCESTYRSLVGELGNRQMQGIAKQILLDYGSNEIARSALEKMEGVLAAKDATLEIQRAYGFRTAAGAKIITVRSDGSEQ